MIKDILKVAMAISCIVLALATATYFNDLKDNNQKAQDYQIYENNLNKINNEMRNNNE